MTTTVTPPPVSAPILSAFDTRQAQLFGHQPQRLAHTLHRHPLFSREALAELIDRTPRSGYGLIAMGEQGAQSRRFWREGEKGDLTGAEVIAAIESGRIWINLRDVKAVDPRYQMLLDGIFGELEAKVPGLSTFTRGMGILISSPKAQVYYHADLPGQSLWQISGRKRVYVYPATPPFLRPQDLEAIALHGVEVDLPYEAWFDAHAQVFDIEPGEWLHWPLNAPHRVENFDCLNVSMTLEYFTDDIRRAHMVNVANGLLRGQFGQNPQDRSLTGPIFWSKALLQKGLKNAPWLKRERARRRAPSFRLDRRAPGHVVELAAAAE